MVTTLLFNFIFLLFISMLLEGPLKDPMGMGWPKSARLIPEAPPATDRRRAASALGFRPGDLIGALRLGDPDPQYIRAMRCEPWGLNKQAAGFAGIPVNFGAGQNRALLSGGLAALGGFSEVAGLKGSLTPRSVTPGFGYTRHHRGDARPAQYAAGVVIAALFVGRHFLSVPTA